MHFGASLMTVDWVAASPPAPGRARLDAAVIDLGGGLGVRHVPEEPAFAIDEFVGGLIGEFARAWQLQGLPAAHLILEPGRSLVSRAGVTLYTVGGVKRASAATTYVTIDGGMSDNPRPAMYGARYTALLVDRVDAPVDGAFAVAGKHCESGDVLIDRVELPEPRRGDVLAVPATGAYTLAMSSTYNAVPRPAAALVATASSADPPPRDRRRSARLRALDALGRGAGDLGVDVGREAWISSVSRVFSASSASAAPTGAPCASRSPLRESDRAQPDATARAGSAAPLRRLRREREVQQDERYGSHCSAHATEVSDDPEDDDDRLAEDVLRRPEEPRRPLRLLAELVVAERAAETLELRMTMRLVLHRHRYIRVRSASTFATNGPSPCTGHAPARPARPGTSLRAPAPRRRGTPASSA